jgi:hypothetical protein
VRSWKYLLLSLAMGVAGAVAACGSEDDGGDVLVEQSKPTCKGRATACILLDKYDCSTALGCKDESYCTGVRPTCSSQLEYSCKNTEGCRWEDDDCWGVPLSCFDQTEQFSCTNLEGCSWHNRCSGIVTDCEVLDEKSCKRQPGCKFELALTHYLSERVENFTRVIYLLREVLPALPLFLDR